MNKTIIIKYISGQATPQETEEVLKWVSENKENETFFLKLMNLWIAGNMPEEKADESEVRAMMDLIERKEKKGVSKLVIYSIAASFLLLISVGLWLMNPSKKSDFGTHYITYDAAISKMMYTDKGVKGCITLPDSSVVWLNSDSKLYYPEEFTGNVRHIFLSGEAFFEVKNIPEMPMIVGTHKGFSIEVLGTTFNLKSYENDDRAEATLYTGNINLILTNPQGKSQIVQSIKPNQTITINNALESTIFRSKEPENYSAWKEGKIIFHDTPMAEVIKILNRWHGVDFIIEDEEILDSKFTARFNTESIVQIMDLLRLTSYVNYRIDGKTIYISKR